MIQQRNVVTAIILTIVTCGIYGIYWFIVMTNEAGKLSGDPDFTGGKHFLLTLITCGVWTFIWCYQIAKQLEQAQRQRGMVVTDNAVLYVLLSIFGLGIVTYALAQSEINKMV